MRRNFPVVLLSSVALVAGGFGAAAACIPDLPQDPDDSDGLETGPSSSSSGSSSGSSASGSGGSGSSSGSTSSGGGPRCGDGIIQLDAGEQCDPGSPIDVDAAVSGCTGACQMQCPGFLWPRNNHCYEIAASTANGLGPGTTAASGFCTALFGGHVVTFASDDEFRAVAGYFADAGAFWVGVQESTNSSRWASINPYEPGWSPVCSGCYAHLEDDASTIPLHDSKSTTSFCVQASAGINPPTWQGIPCSNLDPKINVICEHEPSGAFSYNCPQGLCIELPATFGVKRYVLNPLPSTADDAARACAGLGGRLLVLQSRDERDQLWTELGQTASRPPKIWIGLAFRSNDAGSPADAGDAGDPGDAAEAGPSGWYWDDDTPVDGYPLPWAGNEPRTGATITPRAYMAHYAGLSDDTLAHSLGLSPGVLPSSVCELTVGDGGR